MATYNLQDEAWIPVLWKDGTAKSVSLKTALLEAHNIREVYADTPVETAALNRLLLALYLRIFPDQEELENWAEQLEAGAFEPEPIEAYLAQWYHRFDLFHEERPFYQTPRPLKSDKGEDFVNPIEKLFTEEASNNNPVFYSHTSEMQKRLIPLDKAARGTVTTQAYAIGGGVAKPFNFANAPMVGTAMFWVRGQNLFEMLLKNAPPTENCWHIVSASYEEDLPAWEADLPRWENRIVKGYLDYLTWQSRAIKLVTQIHQEQVFAAAVVMHQGDKLGNGITDDPLLAYKVNKEGKFYALSFSPDKALWRDATTFLNIATTASSRSAFPHVFDALSTLERGNTAFKWETDVLGMSNDQGTVNFYRQERMPIYQCFLENGSQSGKLSEMIEWADKQKENLRWATKTMCEWVLATPKEDESVPKADAGAVSKLIEHFQTIPRYWAALEVPFYEAMAKLAEAKDTPAQQQVLEEWGDTIYNVASAIFSMATEGFEASGRNLRAVAEGEQKLMGVKQLRTNEITKTQKPKKANKNQISNLFEV